MLRGLKAEIFDLGLIASGLVLMQSWPRSHEGCPRGLVVSHRNHVFYIYSFLIGNCNILLKLTVE